MRGSVKGMQANQRQAQAKGESRILLPSEFMVSHRGIPVAANAANGTELGIRI